MHARNRRTIAACAWIVVVAVYVLRTAVFGDFVAVREPQVPQPSPSLGSSITSTNDEAASTTRTANPTSNPTTLLNLKTEHASNQPSTKNAPTMQPKPTVPQPSPKPVSISEAIESLMSIPRPPTPEPAYADVMIYVSAQSPCRSFSNFTRSSPPLADDHGGLDYYSSVNVGNALRCSSSVTVLHYTQREHCTTVTNDSTNHSSVSNSMDTAIGDEPLAFWDTFSSSLRDSRRYKTTIRSLPSNPRIPYQRQQLREVKITKLVRQPERLVMYVPSSRNLLHCKNYKTLQLTAHAVIQSKPDSWPRYTPFNNTCPYPIYVSPDGLVVGQFNCLQSIMDSRDLGKDVSLYRRLVAAQELWEQLVGKATPLVGRADWLTRRMETGDDSAVAGVVADGSARALSIPNVLTYSRLGDGPRLREVLMGNHVPRRLLSDMSPFTFGWIRASGVDVARSAIRGTTRYGEVYQALPLPLRFVVCAPGVASYEAHLQLASLLPDGHPVSLVGFGMVGVRGCSERQLNEVASRSAGSSVLVLIELDGRTWARRGAELDEVVAALRDAVRRKPMVLGRAAVNGSTVIAGLAGDVSRMTAARSDAVHATFDQLLRAAGHSLTALSEAGRVFVGSFADGAQVPLFDRYHYGDVELAGSAGEVRGRLPVGSEVPVRDMPQRERAYQCVETCRTYLDGYNSGGITNQREHLVNMLIAAPVLGACGIVMPRSTPYDGAVPYPIRPRDCEFGGFGAPFERMRMPGGTHKTATAPLGELFDADAYKAFALSRGLCVVDSVEHLPLLATDSSRVGRGTTAVVQLPLRNFMVDDPTVDMSSTDADLSAAVPALARSAAASGAHVVLQPVDLVNGQAMGLLTVLYTRYGAVCEALPGCMEARTRGLVPRPELRQTVDAILQQLPANTVAFHLRLRGCMLRLKRLKRIASWLRLALAGRNVTLYVLSELAVGSTALDALAEHFNLTSKLVLMPHLTAVSYPVEALGYIDAEVASRLPVFVGTDLSSSLYTWVVSERAFAERRDGTRLPSYYIPLSLCERDGGKEAPRKGVVVPRWSDGPWSNANTSTYLVSPVMGAAIIEFNRTLEEVPVSTGL